MQDLFCSLERLTIVPQEILFVDDKSPDDTVLRIENWRENNTHLKTHLLINSHNLGIAGNYNAIISLATSAQWLHILDADDYLMGDYYAAVLHALDQNQQEYDVLVTSYRSPSKAINAIPAIFELLPLKKIPRVLQPLGTITTRSALIYRLDSLKKHPFPDPYFDGFDVIHAYHFLRRQLYIPEAKIFYRIHRQSHTSQTVQTKLTMQRNTREFCKRLHDLPPLPRNSYRLDYFVRKGLGRYFRINLT